MRKNPCHYKKLTAFFLSCLLALEPALSAAPAEPFTGAFPAAAEKAAGGSAFMPDLPADLGLVETSAAGTGPLLVHIQTAHGHEEAQLKIAEILKVLKRSAGISTVLVEGSAHPLDRARLNFEKAYPGRGAEIRAGLLKRGWLKAPELFLLDEQGTQALGIEDQDAYIANGRSFLHVLEEREKSSAYLAALETQIGRLSASILPSETRTLLKHYENWTEGSLGLSGWLKLLGDASARILPLDFSDPAVQIDAPMMVRLWTMMKLESQADAAGYEEQKTLFYQAFSGAGESVLQPVRALLDAPAASASLKAPDTGKTFEAFASALPEPELLKNFPQVMSRIQRLILQSELQAGELHEETERYSRLVLEKSAGSERGVQLLRLIGDYRRLKKLFSLEALPQDVDVLLARHKELSPSALAARFQELNRDNRVRDLRFEHLAEIENLLEAALEFYRGARERDTSMIRNVEKILRERGIEKAAVVTGGFHAQPFERHFRSAGYAYVRVIPAITGPGSREAYVQSAFDLGLRFTRGETWETPFLSDPAFIAPALQSVMPALTRAELRSTETGAPLEFRYYEGPDGIGSLEKDRLEAWLEASSHFKSREEWIKDGENAMIAYAGGKIAGVQAFYYREEDKTLEARGLYVSPEFRRSRYHVALSLRDRLLSDFKARGADFFETNVSPDPGAQAFHRSWALDLGEAVSDILTKRDAPDVLLNIEVDLEKYVPNPAHQSRAELRSLEDLDYGPLNRGIIRGHGARVIEMVHTYPGDTVFDLERDLEETGRLRFDPALSRVVTDPSRGGVPAAFVFASEVKPEAFSAKMPGAAMPAVKSVYLSKFRVENDIRHHGLFIEFYLRFLTEMSALGYQKVYWRVSDLPTSRSPLKMYRRWVQTGAAVQVGRFPPSPGADVPEVWHLGFEGDIPKILESLNQLADYLGLEKTDGGGSPRSELRAAGREALPMLADLLTLDRNTVWTDHAEEIRSLEGLGIGKTYDNGQIIFPVKPGFSYRWPVLGFHDKGWTGRIVRTRIERRFFEFEVELQKEGREPLQRVYQVGSRLHSVAGTGEKKGTLTQVLQISDRLGLHFVEDLLRMPRGTDWPAAGSRLPDPSGLSLGAVDARNGVPMVLERGFLYDWHLLGRVEEGWRASIESVRYETNFADLTVRFDHKDGRVFTRKFQIGPVTRKIEGAGNYSGQTREFLIPAQHPGLDFVAEAMRMPADFHWPELLKSWGDVTGLRLGRTRESGQITVVPHPYYQYGWPVLGFADEGWEGRITAAKAFDKYLEIEVRLTKDGQAPRTRVFSIGAASRSVPGTLAMKGGHKEVRDISVKLGHHLLSSLLQNAPGRNFDSRRSEIEGLPGLSLGRTNHSGQIHLQPYENFPMVWQALPRSFAEAEAWDAVIMNARAVSASSFQFEVLFTNPEGQEVRRSYQAGPGFVNLHGAHQEKGALRAAFRILNLEALARLANRADRQAGSRSWYDFRTGSQQAVSADAPSAEDDFGPLAQAFQKTLEELDESDRRIAEDIGSGMTDEDIAHVHSFNVMAVRRVRALLQKALSPEASLLDPGLSPDEGGGARSELRQSLSGSGPGMEMKFFRDLTPDQRAELFQWFEEINMFSSASQWDGGRDDALVVYLNGRPAGIQAFHRLAIGPVVTAEGLFVAPEYRRSGLRLASRLRDEVLREVQKRGAKMFETLVSPSREAQGFHAAWILDMGPAVFDVNYRRGQLAYISVDVDAAVDWLRRTPEEREAYLLSGFDPEEIPGRQDREGRSELRSETETNLPEITFRSAVSGGLTAEEKQELETALVSWDHFSERARWNGKDREALIVYVNGKPAGAQAYKIQKRFHTASAEGLFIAPEFRRKGLRLAYRLREAWMRQLITQKVATIFIPVADGEEAQGFHKAWAESLGPAVEVLSVDREDPANPIRWLGVDLRKLPQLKTLEDSPPMLVGLEKFPELRSELRTLPGFEDVPFRDYFALRLARAVELTPEEIVTYFGEATYEKAAAENRRYYIRMMQPADQSFLDDWQEEYEADALWRSRDSWPLDWGHELPEFLDLPELSAGLFSEKNGEEKLEGYVSAAVTQGANEYDPDAAAYGLSIRQIEVYYRNIGREGLLKGVPDVLMDYLIKIAMEPESGINDGISMTSTSPGSEALAERYGMEVIEGRERFLSLEALKKRVEGADLTRVFNTAAPPVDTATQDEKSAGLRSLDSLLPYFLHEEVVLTQAEIARYFGQETAAAAAREGITYYLKKLSPYLDLHHLRRWAARYEKDEEWKAQWKDRLDPHETVPHFSRFSNNVFGLMSVRDGHENLEGFIGLESRIRDFDEDALVWTTYVHITQMETFYRNRGREGDLRGVPDVLMDFLMKMIADPSSTVRHGLGLTPMTDGGFAVAQRYKMHAAAGGDFYLTQEDVLERVLKQGLDKLFNRPASRSELRFADDPDKLPAAGRVEGFYDFFDFMRRVNRTVREAKTLGSVQLFEDLRYDLSKKTARYTLSHDVVFEVFRRMRRYEQKLPVFDFEVKGDPGQQRLTITRSGPLPSRPANLPFEDPSRIAAETFDESVWLKTRQDLASYRARLESLLASLREGPRTFIPGDSFREAWKELAEGWERLVGDPVIREAVVWKIGQSLLSEMAGQRDEKVSADTAALALRFLINETYKADRHAVGLNRQALLYPEKEGPRRAAQVSGSVIGARVFEGAEMTEFASSEDLFDYLFQAASDPWRDLNREFDWIVVNDDRPADGASVSTPSLDAEEAVVQLRQNGFSGPVTVLMTYPFDTYERNTVFGRTEPGLGDYRVQPQVYRRHFIWENMSVIRHEFDSLRAANVREALPRILDALQEGRAVDAGQLMVPRLAADFQASDPSDVSLDALEAMSSIPPSSTRELLQSLFQPRLARGESLRFFDLASSGEFLRDLWRADPSLSEIASESLALDESALRRFRPGAPERGQDFEVLEERIASRLVKQKHPELKSQVIFLNAPYLDHQEIAETMADEAAHLADPRGSVILLRLHEVDWQYKGKFESEMARWGFKLVKTFERSPLDYPFTQYIRGGGDTDQMLYVFVRVPGSLPEAASRSELRAEPSDDQALNPFQIAFIKALSALQEQAFPLDARAEETKDGMFLPTDPFMAAEILKEVIAGGETLIDLGSGSGVIVFTAAALGAGRAVGFESDPGIFQMSRYLLGKLSSDPRLLMAFNPAKVELRKTNFMKANLAAAGDREDPSKNIYYYFDLSSAAQVFEKEKFLAKLRRLPPGSRLVLHFRQSLEDGDLSFLELEKKIDHGTLSTYVYRVPPAKSAKASRRPPRGETGPRSELRSSEASPPGNAPNRAEALFQRWSRNSFGIFGALALYAHQFEFQPGDQILSVGTGSDPFHAIPLAMRGAAVESISLDPRFQENEESFVKTHTPEITAAGGSYTIHPAGNYLNFSVKPDSKKIVLFFNVLDDPLTQNQAELVERFLTDVEDGGLLIGSVLVPDYYLKAVDQIKNAAAARGYQIENVNLFVPKGAGGSAMPFVFRIHKSPAAKPSFVQPFAVPVTVSRTDNTSRVSDAEFLRSARSELRGSAALERQRPYYREVRAWMLSPEDRLLEPSDQAAFLSLLLERPVYSELAGILPLEVPQLLPEGRLSGSSAYHESVKAAVSEGGRVLFDGAWLGGWGERNPRGLYLLLDALARAGEGKAEPLAGVIGDKELLDALSRAMLKRSAGLTAEETVRARKLAEGLKQGTLLDVLSEDETKKYAERHQGGVAVLHGDSGLFDFTAARFSISDEEPLDAADEAAAAFLLPALFKAASLIRGIGEPSAQRDLLTGKLHEILPGSTFTGGTIAVRLGEFITQNLLNSRLIETAA